MGKDLSSNSGKKWELYLALLEIPQYSVKLEKLFPTQRQTAAEGREEAAAALFLKFRGENDGPAG